MNGRTHALLGLASGLAIGHITGQSHLSWLGIAGMAGGLLPDLDHPKSIISGFNPFRDIVRAFVSHRGLTHTLLFWVLVLGFVGVAYPISQPFVVAVGAGVLSHLIGDMLTPWGVPLLLPVSNFNFTLLPSVFLNFTSWIIEAIATVGALVVIAWVLI